MTVTAQFKVLDAHGTSCLVTNNIAGTASKNISRVTRCTLNVPETADVNAALKAAANDCAKCKPCDDYPFELGGWYQDSFDFTSDVCNAVKPGLDFRPSIAAIVLNPETSITLASFNIKQD